MAVLIEAISVVIKADAVLSAFSGDWEAFKKIVPNETLCADNEIIRVGFMAPDDVQAFIEKLESYGLRFLRDGKALDIAVADQQRGFSTECSWAEFGHVNIGHGKQRVAACRLVGSTLNQTVTPPGWEYENSLSASFAFVPTEHAEKGMKYLRHENGLDVYLNPITGEEVYVGRTGKT